MGMLYCEFYFFQGHYHQWQPFVHENEPCAVWCQSTQDSQVLKRIQEEATDGTRCSHQALSVCLDGHCQVYYKAFLNIEKEYFVKKKQQTPFSLCFSILLKILIVNNKEQMLFLSKTYRGLSRVLLRPKGSRRFLWVQKGSYMGSQRFP